MCKNCIKKISTQFFIELLRKIFSTIFTFILINTYLFLTFYLINHIFIFIILYLSLVSFIYNYSFPSLSCALACSKCHVCVTQWRYVTWSHRHRNEYDDENKLYIRRWYFMVDTQCNIHRTLRYIPKCTLVCMCDIILCKIFIQRSDWI